MFASTATKHARARSRPNFQADLLPLSATVNEGDTSFRESLGGREEHSSRFDTRYVSFAALCVSVLLDGRVSGIGLVVGLQVCHHFVVGSN